MRGGARGRTRNCSYAESLRTRPVPAHQGVVQGREGAGWRGGGRREGLRALARGSAPARSPVRRVEDPLSNRTMVRFGKDHGMV